MQLTRFFIPALAAFLPSAASSHSAAARSASDLVLTGWVADPATLVPMAIALFWYAAGVRRTIVERRSHAIAPSRVLAFAVGMIVLVVALQSPIDTISDDLFSVHMVQHLLLMLAAPPLFVWSDCPIVFLRALPPGMRKAIARFWSRGQLARVYRLLMSPLAVWALFCGAFVFWHSPGPYQWALDDEWIHVLEHLCFFITSLAFWSIVWPPRGRRRLQYGPTLLLVVSTAVLSGLPGALMIFAPRPLYPAHAAGVAKWGLTLLQDQEIAGLIMWIPAGSAYVIAVALLFLAWLKEAEAQATKLARRAAPAVVLVVVIALPLAGCKPGDAAELDNFNGNARRGAVLIAQHGCGGCHTIPGIRGTDGNVGPPLGRVGSRTFIAGFVNNSPANMTLWIENPQDVLPGNAMPNMHISLRDARDMTAFLYTLK